MALISDLPFEIFSMVFLYFQTIKDQTIPFWQLPTNPMPSLSPALINSMGVCQQWRMVIVNTPFLWTQVVCRLPPKCNEALLSTYLSILEVFLQRSGSALLDVFIKMDKHNIAVQKSFLQFLMNVAPFHRWRSLTLSCTRLEPVEVDLVGEFTALESLCCFGDSVQRLPLLPMIGRSALGLRRVELNRYKFQDSNMPSALIMNRISTLMVVGMHSDPPANITTVHCISSPLCPLSNVTHLVIEHFEMFKCNSSSFPRLKRLEVNSGLQPSGTIMTIPCLRYLGIRSARFQGLLQIRAPSLEILALKWVPRPVVYGVDAFGHDIHTPHYQLSPTTLILGPGFSSRSIIQVISASPRVKSLQLSFFPEKIDWFAEALSEKQGVDTEAIDQSHPTWNLCPNLLTLQIRWTQNQTDSESCRDLLHRILQGRAGSPLKSASCTWEDGNEITVTLDAII